MRSHPFRSLRCLALVALTGALAATGNAQNAISLRGYGNVTSGFGKDRVVFECQSSEKADILLGKLLADMFWDAGSQATTSTANIKGTNVTIHSWPPYGAIVVARVGQSVIAVGDSDEANLKQRLESETVILTGHAEFAPAKPYPRYLDNYDLRSLKMYTYVMQGNSGMPLESHWPFLNSFGLNIAFQALNPRQSPAPGVYAYGPIDYELNMANQNKGIAAVGLNGGSEVPLWVWNLNPDAVAQAGPTTLLSTMLGTGSAGSHYESWGITPAQKASTTEIFMRQSMKRYVNDPAVGSWLLYAGSPNAEYGFGDRYTAYLDYSPSGQALFRSWLRDVKRYDLAGLGERWYGNPNRFQTWDQVTVPDANSFYGNFGVGSQRLKDGWQMSCARNGIQNPPPANDPSWIPVDMQPSQQQLFRPWGETFFRVEFNGKPWAAEKACWIVCDTMAKSTIPTEVWLNGKKVGQGRSDGYEFSVDLSGVVVSGSNELVIRVPRGSSETAENKSPLFEGRINGPIFLTKFKPQRYPNLGALDNARAYDFHEWQAYAVNQSHITMMNIATALDPNRPFILSGGAGLLGDQQSAMAERYGCGMEFTGQEGYYNPWWPGVGLLGNFYGTGEESGQTNSDGLTRELGWILEDAESSHCFFLNLDNYQREEQKTGWFTKNKRALQLFGKFLRPIPDIAIFVSSRDERTGSREPWNWDLGRGELQSMHYDNAYATETQLLNGEVNKCPILLDDGTDIMDPDIVQAIQKYVEQGGTYIAYHQTGSHDSIHNETQPLAALTGTISKTHARAHMNFTGASTTLKSLANTTLDSQGVAFYPTSSSNIVPGSEVIPLATYADGSVAISERRIGKGKIIQIGPTYWRDQGVQERNLIVHLLSDLGVKHTADASNPMIWARKVTTKNGLQDWVVAYNNDEKGPETADVKLAVAQKPDHVWDMITGQEVQATYADGYITIPSVSFTAKETHIYGVKHADLIDGLGTWWSEKTRFWHTPPAVGSPDVEAVKEEESLPVSANSGVVVAFQNWKFLADRTETVAKTPAWISQSFDDKSWLTIASGPWSVADRSLADWKGTGLYRSTFSALPGWAGKKVILNLYSYTLPIALNHADLYLNGTSVMGYEAHTGPQNYAVDVSNLIHPGENILAIRVRGGANLSGFNGNVWIQAEQEFSSELNLEGKWDTVGADFKTIASTSLPGKPNARNLQKDFDLPADWNKRTVYLHVETTDQWLGSIVVNGHPIHTNSYVSPFSPRAEVNITPYLQAGKNRIELWPYKTVPSPFQATGAVDVLDMPVTAIRLGVL